MPDFDSMPTTPSQSPERKNESGRRQCGTMARYGMEDPMAGRQNANRPKYQNLATTPGHLSFYALHEQTPFEASALHRKSVPTERTTGADSGTVIVSKLNVRQGPGTHHKIIGSLRQGATITIARKHDDWLAIDYNGKQAFVSAQHVRTGAAAQPSPNDNSPSADQTGIADEGTHPPRMPEKAKVECAPPKPGVANTHFINTYMCSAHPSLGNTSFCQKVAENTTSNASATTKKSDAIPKHAKNMTLPPQGTAKVMTDKLNVRSEPNGKNITGSLSRGTLVDYTAISNDGNWLQIESGWISRELTDANVKHGVRQGTKDKDLAALGREAAALAKSYEGWITGDLAQKKEGEIFSKQEGKACVQLPKLSTLAYITGEKIDNNNGYDKNCANFVSAILVEAGLIHEKNHVNRVRDLVDLLIKNGWQLIPMSQARPGDVWESVGHAEIVTGRVGEGKDKGKVTTFGSNNRHPTDNKIQVIGQHLKDPDADMAKKGDEFREYLGLPKEKVGKISEKEKALLKEFGIDPENGGTIEDLKPILTNLAKGEGEGPSYDVYKDLIKLRENSRIKKCGERIWGIRGSDASSKIGEAADASR